MKNYIFVLNGETCKRVSAATAKKLFVSGKKVYALPCNANPNNGFICPVLFSRKERENMILDDIGAANMFSDLTASFEYYNCNKELGRYASFYVPWEKNKA